MWADGRPNRRPSTPLRTRTAGNTSALGRVPHMSIGELLANAKLRIQRQWPTMMLVDKSMRVTAPLPDGPPQLLKEVHVLAGQDVDAGFQSLSIVAESFGSAKEHAIIAKSGDTLMSVGKGLEIRSGSTFDPHHQMVSSHHLVTGRILHIYTDVLAVPVAEVQQAFVGSPFVPIVRDRAYWQAHDEARTPDLFVCHDSADKDAFVRPLVDALNKKLVKVWYDEQSLRPGESLVESVEKGLNAARYAILILSKNFLANRKWAAREFRSLVTRDIAEERRILIPIWLGVGRDDVARYSLDLADRIAVVVSDNASPSDISDQLIRTLRLAVPDFDGRFP